MIRVLLALAALLAHLVARRSPLPSQRTIARALVTLLAIDLARLALGWLRGAPPHHGFAKASWAASVVLAAAWYVAETWVVLRVLYLTNRGRFALCFAPMIATWAIVGAAYPARWPAEALTRAAFWASFAVQVASLVRWFCRPSRREDDAAERVAVLLVVSSGLEALAVWVRASPGAWWAATNYLDVVTWGTIAGWEAVCLWRSRRSR